MTSEPRVEDEDESAFVWEGFGPANRTTPLERQQVQMFMQRVVRDVQAHPEDYEALRDPLVLLAENYARTCQSRGELARRLERDVQGPDAQAAAAVLLRRLWTAQVQLEQGADGDGAGAANRH